MSDEQAGPLRMGWVEVELTANESTPVPGATWLGATLVLLSINASII
jgi:hypothetical protein